MWATSEDEPSGTITGITLFGRPTEAVLVMMVSSPLNWVQAGIGLEGLHLAVRFATSSWLR